MLIGQVGGLELAPDTAEVIWGVVSLALMVGSIIAVVGLLVWAKRAAQRRAQLESRVERLEKDASKDQPS